jgi:acyloxyacyl hydrolase
VVLVGLAEQLVLVHNETISHSLARLCNYLPSGFNEACQLLLDEFGPGIIAVIESKETPDIACHSVELCKKDGDEFCHLFPLNGDYDSSRLKEAIKLAYSARGRSYSLPPICNIPVVQKICKIIDNFGNNHEPVDDIDGDGFSSIHTFRGADWRGRDCNDFDRQIYPGRNANKDDAVTDSNCNGIFGIDPSTSRSYEEQWCRGTRPMGTMVIGDSAGAHFHIPPEWMTAGEINEKTYQNLLYIAENELDWPMLSSVTGYENTSKWTNDIHGPVDSIYLKLFQLNRCNHRDYQNIAANGIRSSTVKKMAESLSRNKTTDKPLFVTIELVGNDVCSSHKDLFSHMTKPEDFYKHMKDTLDYLDDTLPTGSVIHTVGLVDGRVLYEALKDHIHPLGKTRNDVTYAQYYDFMNCLEISPCFGWMNTNETWRNATSQRAMELNESLEKLVAAVNYSNIDVVNFPIPLEKLFNDWKEKGNDMADLIEPVDGFHPNQYSNALIANITWEMFVKEYSQLLPPANPNNHAIIKQFGQQGGY